MKASEQNTWYCKSAKGIQQGLYNLLVIKKGISVEIVKQCLTEYSDRHINRYNGKPCVDRNFILSCSSYFENFPKFLEIVTEKTGVKFSKRPNRKRKYSYQEWWDQCNTDGTFAYSGVTDDF